MSNYLSIAMVTEALRQLIAQAVSNLGQFSSAPEIRVGRPERTGTPFVGVNIYLYQVSPNASLRNSDLPARFGPEGFAQRPAAALDLDYLLSFHGDENRLEPDRLAGSVIASLHAFPTLTPAFLRSVIATAGQDSPLAASDLADDALIVKFIPGLLSIEELSKLWTIFFQTTHTLSVAYRASAIQIEAPVSPTHALPIRGASPSMAPGLAPVLEDIAPADLTYAPCAELVLRGTWSDSSDLFVRLNNLDIPAEASADGTLHIAFPSAGPVGLVSVQIVQKQTVGEQPPMEEVSNAKKIVIHPQLIPPLLYQKVVDPRTGLPVETITVRTLPPPAFGRKLELWLNPAPGSGEDSREYSFSSPWRLPLPVEVQPLLKPGALSPKLADVFARLGLPLTKRAKLAVVQAGQCWRIANSASENYVIRQGDDGLAVYLGLSSDRAHLQSGIVFPTEDLASGEYLARLHVDGPSGAESILQQDKQQRYSGPLVEVP